ncbi:hypothetical protein GGX14DRAFT_399225 [Mycena pura]|uniref:Uncharacterized protein n=1 Tax=Mycena pura TaxID=153505 RepID=A0AAD6V5Q2_9AGAR|nr:hypothetical protein GGX14DRAFT_399225 [Mycena pura]
MSVYVDPAMREFTFVYSARYPRGYVTDWSQWIYFHFATNTDKCVVWNHRNQEAASIEWKPRFRKVPRVIIRGFVSKRSTGEWLPLSSDGRHRMMEAHGHWFCLTKDRNEDISLYSASSSPQLCGKITHAGTKIQLSEYALRLPGMLERRRFPGSPASSGSPLHPSLRSPSATGGQFLRDPSFLDAGAGAAPAPKQGDGPSAPGGPQSSRTGTPNVLLPRPLRWKSAYQNTADVDALQTVFLDLNALAEQLRSRNSLFYNSPNPVENQLAAHVVSAFALISVADPDVGNSNTGGRMRRQCTRIAVLVLLFGVVSALGAIAVLVLLFLAYRAFKRRAELAHHRLSDAPDVGARPPGREFDQDSVGGQRRRSFYFAEDSLRSGGAQDNAAFEQSRTSPNMMQRRNVMPAAISTPILQQSSMNCLFLKRMVLKSATKKTQKTPQAAGPAMPLYKFTVYSGKDSKVVFDTLGELHFGVTVRTARTGEKYYVVWNHRRKEIASIEWTKHPLVAIDGFVRKTWAGHWMPYTSDGKYRAMNAARGRWFYWTKDPTNGNTHVCLR